MKITYIFRAPSKERSIERVFAPIMEQMKADGHDVQISFAKNSKFWPLSMLYNIIRYSILSRRKGVFHITGDVQYIACLMNKKNTVMTIHDCVTLHNENAPAWFKKMVFKLWYEIPLKRLKYITCISEATRQDLLSYFSCATDKLTVIPNPVGSEFQYTPKEFNRKCPRILHVGTRSNKNLERVIEALDGILCKLVIIGKLTKEQEVLLHKCKIDYINRFHISDADVVAEYQYADIISFPSLFEGFGMPIIEGQTIGRPILTSDRESMKSVAGDGALLVYPESVDAIREGFMHLIDDADFFDSINRAGIINAKQYNIKKIVVGYMRLYRKAY